MNSDTTLSKALDATPCRVVVHSDDKQKELTGTIQLAPSGTDRFRKITLVTLSEQIVLDLDTIITIDKKDLSGSDRQPLMQSYNKP